MFAKKLNTPLYIIFSAVYFFSSYPIYSEENGDELERRMEAVLRQGSKKKMCILYKEIGDCYVQRANSKKAIEAYQKALSFPFGSLAIDKRLEIVKYLVSQRENHLALQEIEKILVHEPHHAESLRYKTQIAPEKIKVCEQYFEEISQAKRDNNQNKLTRLYKELGDLYINLERKDEAIEAYEMALSRPAASLSLQERFKIADFLGDQGHYPTSIAEFKKLIQADANNSKLKIRLATFLVSNKNYEEAGKYIDEVLDIDPNRKEALIIKANLLNFIDRHEEPLRE